jgi:short-subunit dehydrogenase
MLTGRKILITGVSSGIGRALTLKLVRNGNIVWGIARRKELLLELSKNLEINPDFIYSSMDVSEIGSWKRLVSRMAHKNFIPDIVIFNAAISLNDLNHTLKIDRTREMFNVNFFAILDGVENLLRYVKTKTQFVLISSVSALKGSAREGIGYAASKAAISIAFESLCQKFKNRFIFKTVYLGPVATGMNPFNKSSLLTLSEDDVVEEIISAAESKQILFFYPQMIFLFMKVIKFFPSSFYFYLLFLMEKVRFRLKN